MPQNLIEISKDAHGLFIKNDRFNTTLVAFNFYVPLEKETVAEYALLPYMLISSSEKYPEFTELNKKLCDLYGADLSASVKKVGDYLNIKISISVINDDLAFDGKNVIKESVELLLEMIFSPKVKDGKFCEDDLTREKRKMVEHIAGEINEKRSYSVIRLIEEMFEDTPYATRRYGTTQQVNKITAEKLYSRYIQLISTAYIRVNVVGKALPDNLFELIKTKLCDVNRSNTVSIKRSQTLGTRKTVKKTNEYMDVSQGKLVIGFNCGTNFDIKKNLPYIIMTDIFGGAPYSRLFKIVREKLSLCYYCSAVFTSKKGFIFVSSGIEKENADKAFSEICKQLQVMKDGKFELEDFVSSKKSIADTTKSYYDSQSSLENYYSGIIGDEILYSPYEIVEVIDSVTVEDVIKAANTVSLNTVYTLLPKENG